MALFVLSSIRCANAFVAMRRQRFIGALCNRMASTSSTDGLFPEKINVLYDSRCNVCKLEIDWLAQRDARLNTPRRLKFTDIESKDFDETDPANGRVSYAQGMKAIHAVTPDGNVIQGVPVFAIAYDQVGLGWLFTVVNWPVFSWFFRKVYDVFAKYRTYITRGSSLDDLVRAYEERKALEVHKTAANCQNCQPKA
jgi:predicted DCC family thiol-disulfide oxidoreductase YuxK